MNTKKEESMKVVLLFFIILLQSKKTAGCAGMEARTASAFKLRFTAAKPFDFDNSQTPDGKFDTVRQH